MTPHSENPSINLPNIEETDMHVLGTTMKLVTKLPNDYFIKTWIEI